MVNSSENIDSFMMTKANFHDSAHWANLENKYLSRYILPEWDEKATEQNMAMWLDRMGWKEKDYYKSQRTTLKEWISMNPEWPIRAWIGETLELVSE